MCTLSLWDCCGVELLEELHFNYMLELHPRKLTNVS